jgi:hypothetical protein
MSLQVAHILIDVDHLVAFLLNLAVETLQELAELRVLLPDELLVFFEVAADMSEELLKVLRVIEDQPVNDGLVKVNRGEFIGVTLYDYGSHVGEILGNNLSALLHDKEILLLNLLQEASVALNVGE